MNEIQVNDPMIIFEFIADTSELLENIQPKIMELENSPDNKNRVNEIFRFFHTIKGTSAFIGLSKMRDLSHKTENILDAIRTDILLVDSDVINTVFESVDLLKQIVDEVTRLEDKKIDKLLGQEVTGGKKPQEIDINPQLEKIEEILNSKTGIRSTKKTFLSPELEKVEHSSEADILTKNISEVDKPPEESDPGLLNVKQNRNISEESKTLVEVPSTAKIPSEIKSLSEKPPITSMERTTEVKKTKTIRIDQKKLDVFMNLIGELIVIKNSFTHLSKKMEEDYKLPDSAQELRDITYMVDRISDNLESTLMAIRMVPLNNVFQRFPRMVRDLSMERKKEVSLVVIGEDTPIDKTIAEIIGDPLVHLIRNSVDHGIESPSDRIQHGKPESGSVILKAFTEGNSVTIEITDDGKGIDSEVIKRKAIERNVVTESEIGNMNPDEVLSLIFLPGFSTAEKVTNISGRGVGMDVVKTTIQRIKGNIIIKSQPGKGTKIVLQLPLTLAISKSLIVGVGGNKFAIPLDTVNETFRINSWDIFELRGKEVVLLRGEILGLVSLMQILGIQKEGNSTAGLTEEKRIGLEPLEIGHDFNGTPPEWPSNNGKSRIWDSVQTREETAINREMIVVVIDVFGSKMGLLVDELFSQQNILVKPLDSTLSNIPIFSGTTIAGDGRINLVLDPTEILSMVCR